jgi:hypothetical protein
LSQALCFKRLDGVFVPQRKAYVVKPIEQAISAKGLDLKGKFFTLGFDHHLPIKVYREAKSWERQAFIKQARDDGFRKHQRQEPIFKTVVEKNVCKAGRNHASEAVLV